MKMTEITRKQNRNWRRDVASSFKRWKDRSSGNQYIPPSLPCTPTAGCAGPIHNKSFLRQGLGARFVRVGSSYHRRSPRDGMILLCSRFLCSLFDGEYSVSTEKVSSWHRFLALEVLTLTFALRLRSRSLRPLAGKVSPPPPWIRGAFVPGPVTDDVFIASQGLARLATSCGMAESWGGPRLANPLPSSDGTWAAEESPSRVADGCIFGVSFRCDVSQLGLPWQFPVGLETGTCRTLYWICSKLRNWVRPLGSADLQVGQLCEYAESEQFMKQLRQNECPATA